MTQSSSRHPAGKPARLLATCLLLPLPLFAAEAWHCGNDRLAIDFSADADGRPRAVLHFADERVQLPQVPAASGSLYRNDAVRLHLKGDEALFEDGRGNQRTCRRGEPPAASGGFIDVEGRISHRSRIALPADARLTVRIVHLRPAGAPLTLSEQRFRLGGAQSPFPFSSTIDRDLAGADARLAVRARIEHRGRLLLAGEQGFTPDRPAGLQLELHAPGGRAPR